MTQRGRPQDMIPGSDYQDTPSGYDGPIKFVNWNGYKLGIMNEGGMSAEFFDQIARRRETNQSVIIIVTAAPGTGKSYTALRFAQIFDPKFLILDLDEKPLPREDPSQVVFERQHFHYLIGNDSPLDFGRCIVPDEAQYALGARRWYEDIQKDLVESIESVRSKGLIIVIVALHLELLDKIIRKFVLTYMFHLEDRGRATVYRLYTPRFEKEMRKRRLGQLFLRLPDIEKCTHTDCLRCRYSGTMRREWKDRDKWHEIGFKPCRSLRAIYERRKKDFVSTRSDLSAEKSAQKDVRDRKIPDKELVKALYEHRDKFIYNRKGLIESSIIQIILEDELGIAVGAQKAYRLRTRLGIDYPELLPES